MAELAFNIYAFNKETRHMIDRFSAIWGKLTDTIDYTYPEDLDKWKSISASIETGNPVLPEIRPGEVVYLNTLIFSHLFAFDLIRDALFDYKPMAMLSGDEEGKEVLDEVLFTTLGEVYGSDEKLLERLSSRSVLSKRVRAKRFCELEDEFEILARKGYRLILLSSLHPRPYIDAESREKGYTDFDSAIKAVARKYGIAFIVFTYPLPESTADVNTLYVRPERTGFFFIPPKRITVEKNGKEKFLFDINTDDEPHACFSINGRGFGFGKDEA